MARVSFWLGVCALLFVPMALRCQEEGSRQHMVRDLEVVRAILKEGYAPAQWKASHRGWNLEAAFDQAKEKLLTQEPLDLRAYQRVVRDFLNTTCDYHVGIGFASTERAILPFTVRGVKGRYYLAHIQRSHLPLTHFPFEEGDELLSFDGEPVEEVIQRLKREEIKGCHEVTDQALAELMLTRRRGSQGLRVPMGPVRLEVRSQGEEESAFCQVMWEYEEEKIVDNLLKRKEEPNLVFAWGNAAHDSLSEYAGLQWMRRWPGYRLETPLLKGLTASKDTANPFVPGSQATLLPKLGRKLWESQDFSPFAAYLYETPEKHLVGVVRIPHYSSGAEETETFGELLDIMEEASDALVIDQMNNPGGSVFYLYTLASMLTSTAMETPKHRMAISQSDVLWAVALLELTSLVRNDADAKRLFSTDFDGYPVNYQTVLFLKHFARRVIQEWEQGRTYTEPCHLFGVDHIHPHPTHHYSKPILMLINELDFSGGDFLPAILQDNGRVTLMGTRTAGAGGYVEVATFRNSLGVAYFSFTASLAFRKDGSPIEDLGVTPEVVYDLTEEDLQEGFAPFAEAVNKEILRLLEPEEPEAEAAKEEEV